MQPSGANGFGYDPLFYVPTHGCSSAELPPEEKNRISHRGQALTQAASVAGDSGVKLIILDRDGVINEDSDDYIKSAEEWIPIPGSIEAMARLHQAGYTLAIATNQSGHQSRLLQRGHPGSHARQAAASC